MDIVRNDILKADKCPSGYKYILVLSVHFTRYTQINATTNKSAKIGVSKLYNDFFLRFGSSEMIFHDQSQEFKNELFHNLNKIFGISKLPNTPYHPTTNGVERMNSSLIQMLWALT